MKCKLYYMKYIQKGMVERASLYTEGQAESLTLMYYKTVFCL